MAPADSRESSLVRGWLKSLVRRAMRPGVWELQQSLDRLERAAGRAGNNWAEAWGSVWRGGADGHAVRRDGNVDAAMTAKYRAELRYWLRAIRGQDPRHGASFSETFARWQRTRLNELADRLALDRGDAMDEWCRSRDAVEIGGGPMPSVAFRPFLTRVAVDPLADAYMSERLAPASATGVTHVSACGEWLPLAAASADLVIAENCLDHTDDPERVMSEIRRVLRPGGKLWMLVDLMEHRDALHPSPMSQERITALLKGNGFSTQYREAWEGASHPEARLQTRILAERA
jgi:SAM-dependent methyltransferase